MHPLMVTPLYPPATGGAATYFGMVAPELAQRPEVDWVTVLTERWPDQPGESTCGKLRILRHLPTRISIPRQNAWAHALSYAHTQLWFARHFPELVRRCKVDLIHFHTRYRGRLLYAALKRSGVPVIANLHDKMTDPAVLARVADWLLCCARGVQRFAVDGGFPADRIAFIPLPLAAAQMLSADHVAALRRRYGLGAAPYLLFVGDITAAKGVYELLAAYRQWRADPPQARLVFAGTNREGKWFVRQIQQTPDTTYVGPVPREDALALMRGAAVVVLPSRSEGLGYAILEAVSLGTKVVGPPGIPEFESHLRESILPEVNVAAIFRALTAAWARNAPPSYPLSTHNLERVVSELARLYVRVVRNETDHTGGNYHRR